MNIKHVRRCSEYVVTHRPGVLVVVSRIHCGGKHDPTASRDPSGGGIFPFHDPTACGEGEYSRAISEN